MHFAFLSITILQWRRGEVWFSLLSNSRVTIFLALSCPGRAFISWAARPRARCMPASSETSRNWLTNDARRRVHLHHPAPGCRCRVQIRPHGDHHRRCHVKTRPHGHLRRHIPRRRPHARIHLRARRLHHASRHDNGPHHTRLHHANFPHTNRHSAGIRPNHRRQPPDRTSNSRYKPDSNTARNRNTSPARIRRKLPTVAHRPQTPRGLARGVSALKPLPDRESTR